jgi:16S rRNA (uracil1498-N3)-methyltransferase
MHRFYISSENCRSDRFDLGGREAHHATNVLRVRTGEKVVILDGAGSELLCEVLTAHRDELSLKVLRRDTVPASEFQVTLLQAIPKGKLIETIIQKATELGVFRIVPVLSERSVIQLDEESADSKTEKWQQVAIEAIKQCGNPWLPRIDMPMTPKAFFAREERFDLPLIASLQGDRRHPREHFRRYFDETKRKPQSVCVWVGPEGDYTPAELNAIKAQGALPISLGSLVLRSDTAAIYCLSVLNYELQAPL